MLKFIYFISLLFFGIIFSLTLQSCAPANNPGKSYSFPLHQPAADHSTSSAVAKDTEDVRLSSGDVLTISVWGQDALTKEVTLDAAGNIYYPFIGKINASGKTIEELQAEMKEKLSRYYTTPDLTITPKNLAGQYYYVLGEVSNPGNFPIKAKTTVLEAVSSAGGPNDNAGKTVLLLRKQNAQLLIASVSVQFTDITKNNLSSVTTQVRAGDILYMPPSTIADIENFAIRFNNIINPILSLEHGIIFWPELVDVFNGSSGKQEFVVPLQ